MIIRKSNVRAATATPRKVTASTGKRPPARPAADADRAVPAEAAHSRAYADPVGAEDAMHRDLPALAKIPGYWDGLELLPG
jgi:hypothetical protein